MKLQPDLTTSVSSGFEIVEDNNKVLLGILSLAGFDIRQANRFHILRCCSSSSQHTLNVMAYVERNGIR